MWRLALVALVGCGRLSFDQMIDGSSTRDGDVDSNAPIGAPFGPPQKVVELATVNDEDDPSLTDDMLEIFFDDNTTMGGLAHATRSAVNQPWSAPVPVAEINAGGNVNNMKISGDGLTIEIEPMVLPGAKVLYFTSMGLWRTERSSTTVAFGSRVAIPELDSGTYDGSMFVSPDERVAYFHSDRVTSLERAIYRATRANATDPFGAPVRLTELDMPGREEDPWLSPDGHVLYFASNTAGQYDLYTATR